MTDEMDAGSSVFFMEILENLYLHICRARILPWRAVKNDEWNKAYGLFTLV